MNGSIKIKQTQNNNLIEPNVDNMKWLGFGATNLSHATKLTK